MYIRLYLSDISEPSGVYLSPIPVLTSNLPLPTFFPTRNTIQSCHLANMIFPIRSIALVALTLTSCSTAGPIVKGRAVQERATGAQPLITSVNALSTVITTAQNDVSVISSPSGITVASIGVGTCRVLTNSPKHEN
jgi:hypothetical protein